MVDQHGQIDIRSIDIQRIAMAYSEEASIFKSFVQIQKTSAREIRWQSKTAGILTATSPAVTSNVASGAQPFILASTWTRTTSYVRKYFVESEIIPEEDIKDNQVNLLLDSLRDLVIHIENDVDTRIWNVLTEDQTAVNISTNATTAAWDAGSGQDIVEDIEEALENIRTNTKEKVVNPILFLNPHDYKSMITWLISTKGSSIPNFSSQIAQDGVVDMFLSCRIVVSNNVTTDYALLAVPDKACIWYEFTPLTTAQIEEKGIGTKLRVWEEGEAILVRPKFCNLITNTKA